MQIYSGKSVFSGIAIGKICVYQKSEQQVKRVRTEDSEKEWTRYNEAKEKALDQLRGLYEKALKEVGEANAAIFEVHQMMLEDDDYNESIENIIRTQKVNAEYAVASTSDNFSTMFSSMDDDYMKERAADVKDISERILSLLAGGEKGKVMTDEPVIIVADDLAPSETVQLEKDKVLSFVTVHGSVNSHTAILARTMAIPALIGTEMPLDERVDGKFAVVDGVNGKIYVEPDEETFAELKERQKKELEKKELLLQLKGKENITLDGKKIMLYANIGNIKDLATVVQNDAGGIGLFRSEFIYMENGPKLPTEEQQFQVYRLAAEAMGMKKVVIRTADLGGEKTAECLDLGEENNPEMGYRGIRVSLDKDEIFKTQLRAILRASAYGKMSIMFPMVTDVKEVQQAKLLLEKIKKELKDEKIPFNEEIQIGVMIETPAAVMISGELAREADFFSIGTNDLTQLTLGMDRTNSKLDHFYNPHHPALLKMIRIIANNVHLEGKTISICGDLAADLDMTEQFLQMGIDELSVAPNQVLALRKKIREIQ